MVFIFRDAFLVHTIFQLEWFVINIAAESIHDFNFQVQFSTVITVISWIRFSDRFWLTNVWCRIWLTRTGAYHVHCGGPCAGHAESRWQVVGGSEQSLTEAGQCAPEEDSDRQPAATVIADSECPGRASEPARAKEPIVRFCVRHHTFPLSRPSLHWICASDTPPPGRPLSYGCKANSTPDTTVGKHFCAPGYPQPLSQAVLPTELGLNLKCRLTRPWLDFKLKFKIPSLMIFKFRSALVVCFSFSALVVCFSLQIWYAVAAAA